MVNLYVRYRWMLEHRKSFGDKAVAFPKKGLNSFQGSRMQLCIFIFTVNSKPAQRPGGAGISSKQCLKVNSLRHFGHDLQRQIGLQFLGKNLTTSTVNSFDIHLRPFRQAFFNTRLLQNTSRVSRHPSGRSVRSASNLQT